MRLIILKFKVIENKKIIKQMNRDIQLSNKNYQKSINSKDKRIQTLQTEVTNLKEQVKILHAKERGFEKSQNDIDYKFNKLLETIKSQGQQD